MKKEIIIHILCEGQTEQGFVDKVLKPYLQNYGITGVKSTLVMTNKKKNALGGMISYQQASQDLSLLFKSNQDDEYTSHYFTTMFDFYAMPNDFPNFAASSKIQDKYAMIESIEKAFAEDIKELRFLPYIQLHEFEALVLCGLDFLKERYPQSSKKIAKLQNDINKFGNPELINHGVSTAPSKRIINAIESDGKQKYNKPQNGKIITALVGIDKLRELCPHFSNWIQKILETNIVE